MDVRSPLPARRHDVIVREDRSAGLTAHLVKDPLTRHYFRFASAEYLLFQRLDGHRSAEDLRVLFLHEFPDRSLAVEDVARLVLRWQQAGLLVEPATAATSRVTSQWERRQQRRWHSRLSNLLYLKVHAFDPDPLLNRLYPWTRWMFQPTGVALSFSLILAAVLLVVGQFDRFVSHPELQSVHAHFTLQNLVWFWLTVGVVKVLHEFGHGLACKHFGGECHAMGLLLMVFTPSLYCDVSDTWMLPNKWHRIAVAAAGIYVEVVIAALATFVWWSTSPGIVHSIAFAAMVFGSVQTILINANPLMRYDGYYALSDLLEVPNLRPKSQALLKRFAVNWFWNRESESAMTRRERGAWFVLYAVAATVYGWLVTVLLIWFLTRMLEPYKLSPLGWGLALLAVINIVVLPVVGAVAAAGRNPSAWLPKPWWRPLPGLSLLVGLIAAFAFVPVPQKVHAVLTIEPVHAERVSVAVEGRLVRTFVGGGQRVAQGDPLVELDNAELRSTLEQFVRQRELLDAQQRTARAMLDVAREQQVRSAQTDLDALIALHQRRLDGLVLRAPCDGLVITEPWVVRATSRDDTDQQRGPQWNRTPLHAENVGAVLAVGTVVCRISQDAPGHTSSAEAVAILSQRQVERIRTEQPVSIKLDALPGETLLGSVSAVGGQAITEAPPQLLNVSGGELPAIPFGPGAGHLAAPHHHVRIRLLDHSPSGTGDTLPSLPVGLRGRCWIQVGSQPLAMRTWRWLCEVFQS